MTVRRLLPAVLLSVLAVLGSLLVAPAPAQAAGYTWSSGPIDAAMANRMRFSWRSGCPVPLKDLRYMRMTHWRFDGRQVTGEMVVHRDEVQDVAWIFGRAHAQRFPIRQMRLVDDFQGSDDASMAADNTSAFNCRKVEGSSSWSQHAYGRAVDINPVENPYVAGRTVEPPAGRPYVTRSPYRQGMVTAWIRDTFAAKGWGWGGNFKNSKDWQHFSTTGT